MADGYEEEFDPASEGEEETGPAASVKAIDARPVASPIVPIPAVPAAVPTAVATPLTEADRAIQAALDSGMWKKQFDPTSQKHYYFHTQTKATTWDLAKELGVGQKKSTSSRVSGFGGRSESSSIVSPSEQPLLLKLPERYRSFSADADGQSAHRTSDGEEESSGGKGDSAGQGYQKLTRYQAFGSVSAAQDVSIPSVDGAGDGEGDDVAHSDASLTSEPAEVKVHSARRADSAREGFKRALSSAGRSDAQTEESATSNQEDPIVKRGFEKYNTFRAFGSTSPATVNTDNIGTAAESTASAVPDAHRASSGSNHEAPAVGAATKGHSDRLAVPKSTASDSSSMFSTASQAIGLPKVSNAVSQVPPLALPTPAANNNPATTVVSPTLASTLSLQGGPTTAGNNGAPLPPAGITFVPYVVPAKTAGGADALPTTLRTATMSTPIASGSTGGLGAATCSSTVDPKLMEIRETTDAVERLVRAFTHLRGMDPSEPNADRVRNAIGRSVANGTHHDGSAPAFASVRWQPTTHVRADTRTLEGDVAATRRRAEQNLILHGDRNDVGMRRLHEDLLESSIVDCVLDMMTNDTAKRMVAATVSTRASRQTKPLSTSNDTKPTQLHPQEQQHIHETITIEQNRKFTDPNAYRSDLRQAVALSAPSLHRNEPWSAYQAFTTWRSSHGASSSAFGEGEQSLAVLAQEALNKYVLRHLMLGTLHPPLVRIMLLDLMAVCMDAAVTYFGSEDNSLPTVPMVLIRFDGSEKDLGLATQICHALPFESLSTTDEASSCRSGECQNSGGYTNPHSVESGVKRRRMFRLEHWVCRLHLWVMIHALQATLRRAEAIDADAYQVFQLDRQQQRKQHRQPSSNAQESSKPTLDADDQIFIPQERRMFSLLSQDKLPTEQQTNAFDAPRGPAESSSRQAPAPPSTALQEALLDAVAGTVRTIAATLTQHPAFDQRDACAVGDVDQHQCVVETVQELLQDGDIRQAVEKRAAQKLMARALKRMEDTSKASDIREGERQRRDEQLRIIRDAEDRASRMVDEIRAELARPQQRVKAA